MRQPPHPARPRIVSKAGIRIVTAVIVIAALLVALFGLLDALADHATRGLGEPPVSKTPRSNDHGGPDRGADSTEPGIG